MQYKVKVIKLLLKNNKIAKAGDFVKKEQLVDSEASLKGGYVEEVKPSKKGKTSENKEAEKKGADKKGAKK